MNGIKQIGLFLFFAVVFSACKNDLSDTGMSILPDNDEIIVSVDTFDISSAMTAADYIYSSPDSLLLGEADNMFGTVHADVLTQLTCPIGFAWPEGAWVDSVSIYMYYRSWYGDGLSPLGLTVYELDRLSFSETSPYPNTLDLSEYWSGDERTKISERERIVVAARPTDSVYNSATRTYVNYIRFKTTQEFAETFFRECDFSSQEAFNEQLKGLYITSNFGGSTILHVSDITLAVHYSFQYQKGNEGDTIVHDTKAFYSNSEVRKVNRVVYTNSQLSDLQSREDSIDYVVSPANIYTTISVPSGIMCDSILAHLGDKRPYVNRALLSCEVFYDPYKSESEKTRDDWASPASYMMLIKESMIEEFLSKRFMPTDTCAVVSALTRGTTSTGETYYYYSYDLAAMLTEELRKPLTGGEPADSLHLVLVPVSASIATNNSGATVYSTVRPQQTISATAIRSAQSSSNPTRLEVVYSGF